MYATLPKIRPLAISLSKFSSAAAITAALLLGSTTPSKGVIVQWDPDGSSANGATGGPGTWNTTNTFWFDPANPGNADIAWPNTTADQAQFASGTGTVTLGGAVNANALQFDVTGYTVTASTVTLGGTSPFISVTNSGQSATVASILAGSTAWSKTGAGTLTLSGANTFSAGMNLTGGTLIVTSDGNFGAVPAAAATNLTIDGGTLQENTGFNLNANRQVAIGVGGATFNNNATTGNFNIMGVIKDAVAGAGPINLTGTGTTIYVPANQNTYSGGTHVGATATTVPNSNSVGSASTADLVSGPYGTGTLFLDGGKMRAQSGTNDIVGNAVRVTGDTTFIAGSTNTLTFTGPLTLAGGARTFTMLSAADVTFGGVIDDGGNNLGLVLGNTSTGTLVLNGANTYTGSTTVNGGTLALTSTASFANPVLTAQTGGTIQFRGNSVLTGTAPVLTAVGNTTPATSGTLSLLDGTFNTVNLNTSTPATPALVLGGAAAGSPSVLNLEVGSTSDQIVLNAGGKVTVNPGGVTVNVSPVGSLNGTTQTLIAAPGGFSGTGAFTLGIPSGTGNKTLSLVQTATALTLVEAANPNAAPAVAYFKGNLNNGLTYTDNTLANNFTTDAAGTTPALSLPNAQTDLHFYATNATTANLAASLLNQNLSVRTITLEGGSLTTAVSIAPGGTTGTLTLTPASAASGVTVNAGAGAFTVSAPVILGASATLTNNSSSAVNYSGGITGTGDLVITDSGTGGTSIGGTLNNAGTITRSASNSAAQNGITATIGSSVTGIIQNNPNTTSSFVLDGVNTAYAGTTTVNAGRLDARNVGTTNVIQALGSGPVILNGGTLDLRGNGAGSAQIITVANPITVAGPASIDVNRFSANTVNAIQIGNLAVNANQLTISGGNGYILNVAGTTSFTVPGTVNATTAPLNLLGQVTDGGNALIFSGASPTRLFNTATGGGANALTGSYTVNGSTLQAFAPAAGSTTAGTDSLGSASVALNGTNPTLRLTPALGSTLTVAPTAGIQDKSFVSGATLTSLALTNFLGATQPIIQGTTPGQTTAGGANPTGLQTVTQINIPSAATATTASHQFTGLLKITTPGVYNFSTFTDDGGNLFIDGNAPVVTANTTVTGAFYLTAGLHLFTSRWNNNAGNGGDTVSYQGPDQPTLGIIPASALFNTTAAQLATSFGNSVSIASGTNATVDIAANTTVGALSVTGNITGTTLNVTGSGDINTLTSTGTLTTPANLAVVLPTANLTVSGGLSGAGTTLTKTGFGNLTLGGTINATQIQDLAGTVTLAAGSTLGTTNILLNGGAVDLGGQSRSASNFTLLNGSVTNGTLSGGSILKQGPGTLVLSAATTGTTSVTVNQGLPGTTSNPATFSNLNVNFAATGAPATNLIGGAPTLTLGGSPTLLSGGGQLSVTGAASAANSQAFSSTLIDGGSSALSATIGTGGTIAVNLGTLTRNAGGTVDFTLPSPATAAGQTATNGFIVPGATGGTLVTDGGGTAFATVGGNDFAAFSLTNLGNIVGASVAGASGTSLYTAASSGATFSGNADVTATFAANSDSTVNSIRLNTGAPVLTLAGTNTVTSGAILFGNGITAVSSITGGTIIPGPGKELVIISGKNNVLNTVGSVLADGPSGPTTVTFSEANVTGTTGGIIDLKSNNTYTGPTYINSGRVATQSVAVTTPFGTGNVYVDGNNDGQFFSNQNTTIANNFFIIGNGLNENNTRSGALRLQSTAANSNPTLSGTVTLLGDTTIGNPVLVANGYGVISGNIATSNAAGSSSFLLTKAGAGGIRLSGTNNQTATNIAGGILNVTSDAALGLTSGALTFTGTGTLQYQNVFSLAPTRAIVLNSGVTASFDTGPTNTTANTTGAATTISNVISGAGSFQKSYANQLSFVNNPLILTAVNTFTGNVNVKDGALIITNSSALGTGTKTITVSPTTNPGSVSSLQLDGTSGDISLPATMSFTTSYDALNGATPIAGMAAIVNIAGNNTIAGNFNLTSGGGGTSFLSNAGTLNITGTLTPSLTGRLVELRGNGAGVISGVIANGNTVDMPVNHDAGSGTWTLSGANTYSGPTNVQTGTIRVGNARALGFGGVGVVAAGTIVSAGATLDLNGIAGVNEAITLNGTGIGANGALINSAGTAATIANGLAAASITANGATYSAPPAITVTGGGGSGATATSSLGVTAATFTITGGTNVYSAAPTVAISGGNGINATATAILSGGTTGTVTGITITGSGLNYTAAPTIAFSGGTITTTGTAPTGTGNATNFQVTGIAITNPGSGYTSTPTLTFASGTASASALLSGVQLASDSSIGGAGDLGISSSVAGTGGLTKVGTGTVTLSGADPYTGSTNVNAGTLLVNGSISGSTAVTVNTGGTLGGTGGTIGTTSTVVTVNGGGTVSPGSSVGTLNVGTATGNSVIFTGSSGTNAALKIEVDATSNAIDLLNIKGNLDLSGAFDQLSFALLNGTSLSQPSYTFATYTGTLSGTFNTVTGAPSGYAVDYSTPNAINLIAVPEPSTFAALLGGAALLLSSRRRRSHGRS